MANIYTNEQKERMISKLKNMPSETKFELNKKDVCPITTRIVKYIALGKNYIKLVDEETGVDMVVVGYLYGQTNENECYEKLVDNIEEMIYDWDLVTKQHFIDLGRKDGMDI